ncbi:universal stress protein [Paraconexibacter sp.]|uniref:universal stress protein n=1 Tax=Paraconexibacter sp. TaxID=2949640 RepID=UPI003568D546
MSSSPVLIAYDGRTPSALRVGDVLARTLRLDVVLATAYHYEPVASSSRQVPGEGNVQRYGRAEAIVERAAAEIKTPDVRTRTLPAEDTHRSLVDLAVEIDATAIVVGPDIQGDVTRSLGAGAPCPVVVAPEDPRLVSEALDVVGVAYDGSVGSRYAVTAATDLAERTGGMVRLIAVATDQHHGRETQLAAEHALDGVEGLAHEVEIRYGEISRELREASRNLDLLICGSHGRGRIMRGLLGSVSTELIELPNCPVMVIPSGIRRLGGSPLGLSSGAAA